MNDKLFDLMKDMHSEMHEMKEDKHEMKENVSVLKSDIHKILFKLENDIDPKLEALIDLYKQTYELEKGNGKKLDDIISILTRQEDKIKVIQGGRK